MTERDLPEYRPLITGDIENYSSRTGPQQGALQKGLMDCLEAAAEAAGLSRLEWLLQPSGDGECSVLPQDTDMVRLTDVFLREFDIALAVYNRRRQPFDWTRMRVRLALHVGPVHVRGANGFPGDHGVQVGRLVDAPALRDALAACPGADLAVIVSDRLYDDYIVQGYGELRPAEFRQVHVVVKNQRYTAYVYVPNHDVHDISVLARYDMPESSVQTESRTKADTSANLPTVYRARNVTFGSGDINEAHGDQHFHRGGGR